MKKVILLICIFITFFLSFYSYSSSEPPVTALVPNKYPNIQAAINDANNGDIITVAPGIYTGEGNVDIDFKGKRITLKSVNGPQTCIIDCNGTQEEEHRGFELHKHEDSNSVIQGFTVRNGYAQYGGGILCASSKPLIRDCIITKNTAYRGAGICGDPYLKNCIISNNAASDIGGGLLGRGGLWGDLLSISNCIITGNKAKQGAGIYFIGNNADFINCTISGNKAIIWGGGIFFSNTLKINIDNSIVYGNMAPVGRALRMPVGGVGSVGSAPPRFYKVSYSIIGSEPNAVDGMRFIIIGQHLQEDPLFVNPGHWDHNGTLDDPNDDFWVDGDYHLKSQGGRWNQEENRWIKDSVKSPCIDIGDPKSPIGDEPQPNGNRINIGAYGGTLQASLSKQE